MRGKAMTLLNPKVWVALAIALVLAYGGGRWQQSRADQADFDAERTRLALGQASAQIKAVDEARIEEQRRTAAQTEIANAATKDLERARGDARTADDAAERLRVRVAELLAASRAGKDSGASSPGADKPGGDPLDVLVGVLERSDRASGILAYYADRLKVAGLSCERSYDSLTPAP
ncbi:hypothetical protein D3C81_1306200 [compost metagenome]